MQEDLRKLFKWEAEARALVAEASALAQRGRDEAQRKRTERLAQAKQNAMDKAEQRKAQILEQVERDCQLKQAQAEEKAARIRTEAIPHLEAAVQAGLEWLLGWEDHHVGGS